MSDIITSPKGIRNEWKPNKKQSAFLAIPWTIKEGFYGGGAGSGKSDVLLMYGIVHKLHLHPRFKQVFMRRTRPDLKKEIVGRSRDLYSRFGATYNGTDMVWTFPREDQFGSGMRNAGAQIFLGICEEEKDVHNYDSMEISLFTPDELTNCTEFIYLYIAFQRNRAPKDSGLPSISRAAGMPGGVGHTFVKKRFVDPAKAGGVKIIGKGGNSRIYIHATLTDNEEHIDPSYSKSLDGIVSEAERKAKKYGDWSAYLGQVFDEFRDRKYIDEPENALHAIPAFEIPSWWPRYVIGDWGFAAMTYIIFIAISPTKRIYVYRELQYLKTKITVWGAEVKEFIDKDNPRMVKFCQSAKQDRGTEHTVQSQIEESIGTSIEFSTNSSGSRIATKMLLHEYLRWKPKPRAPLSELPEYNEEHALWLMRVKGMEEYKQYLDIWSEPEEERDIPKLQVFLCDPDAESHEGHPNCCPILIDSIKACNYDKPKNNKPVEDVAEFEGDDPYDAIRYAVDSAERYFDEAAQEFEKVQREAELIERLNNNQDFTAYYRNMRTIEAGVKSPEPVSRFHRRRH